MGHGARREQCGKDQWFHGMRRFGKHQEFTARGFRVRYGRVLQGGGKRRVVSIKSGGSSSGRAAAPGARATGGWGSSADAPDPRMRFRGMPSPGTPAGIRGSSRDPEAEPPRNRGFPAGHRWHRGSGGPGPVFPGIRHRSSSTIPGPSSAPPRNSTAGWRPRGPAGRRRWQRGGTSRLGAPFPRRIPKMHPSRRGSSPVILPLDSPPRSPHLAAPPMAEIHTADLSSLDTDALKSRLTQLGRYL